MNKRLSLSQLSKYEDELLELYWLAGFIESNFQWSVRTVFRGITSGHFYPELLPIGLLPLLSLGRIFERGKLLALSARGMTATVTIPDVSQFDDITSADIPSDLYSFESNTAGVQRLFRYRTELGTILIPTIELIRHLFIHNRLLANSMMRPGSINLLFHPEVPGRRKEMILRFTNQVPSNYLSHQFGKEFAWMALDIDARRAWDSIYLQSHGEQYVTFTPPKMINSEWTFSGIKRGDNWLVLELFTTTGKVHPCDVLHFTHPSLKKIIRIPKENVDSEASERPQNSEDEENPGGRTIFDFKIAAEGVGANGRGHQKSALLNFKPSIFDREIEVKKILLEEYKAPQVQPERTSAIRSQKSRRETILVSAGEAAHSSQFPPIEFNRLVPAEWDYLGDLRSLSNAVQQMAEQLPEVIFSMSLCHVKGGKTFSLAGSRPRVALVVFMTMPNYPTIILLDVERTGIGALSLVAMRFRPETTFQVIELAIQKMLDGLVDNSGHWSPGVESLLADICTCERLPKLLTPRHKADVPGKSVAWAWKIIHKLGLPNDAPCHYP